MKLILSDRRTNEGNIDKELNDITIYLDTANINMEVRPKCMYFIDMRRNNTVMTIHQIASGLGNAVAMQITALEILGEPRIFVEINDDVVHIYRWQFGTGGIPERVLCGSHWYNSQDKEE